MRRIAPFLLVLGVLAGCGSGSGGEAAVRTDDAYTLLRAAPAAAQEAGPARMSMRFEVDGGPTVTASGVMDLAGQVSSIDMAVPGAGSISMVMSGVTMYMKFPAEAAAELGVTTPWVSMDIAKTGEAATGVAGGGFGGSASNPSDALATLRGVAEDGIKTIGTEEVRGVETTHYQADVDVKKAMEEAGGIVDREAFEQFAEQFGGGTSRSNIWLDDDGLVRRMAFEIPTAEMSGTVTMELYDYGEVASPEVPDGDDVTDISDKVIAQLPTRA